MQRILYTCLLTVLFIGSSQNDSALDHLAASGQIQPDAPVKASLHLAIDAPPERIWSLLTHVSDWPRWHAAIKQVQLNGPVAPGTAFTWTLGSTGIHSRIALVSPNAAFAWTGSAYMAKAIHVWKLQPLSNGRTLVAVDESMDGFLLKHFYSSDELRAADKSWLDDLKRAAEK
jgi:uncharacterized protein YndB with AHSA1/START domain